MKRKQIKKLVTNLVESVAALYEEKEDKEKVPEEAPEKEVTEAGNDWETRIKQADSLLDILVSKISSKADDGDAYDEGDSWTNRFLYYNGLKGNEEEVISKLIPGLNGLI